MSFINKAKTICHLHTHTEFSVFDGCGKQESFIKKAIALGMPAIALTEHGSMRGVYKQNENCREQSTAMIPNGFPIKPIFGIEFYLCDDMTRKGLTEEETAALIKDTPRGVRSEIIYQEEVRQGIRARFHLTALAMNNVGLVNLYKLSSLAWVDGYWKRPRIDLAALYKYHEGVIILSGCLSGVINHHIINGDVESAISKAEEMKGVFGDRFYLELMPHSVKGQATANKGLIQLSSALDIPMVATQDAHWVNDDDAHVQEVLLCIHTKKTMAMEPGDDIKVNRFKFDTDEFWFKTREEMEDTFRKNHGYMTEAAIKSSLDTTLEINERIDAKLTIDRKKGMVPKVPMPPEFNTHPEMSEPHPDDEYDYMVALCAIGWEKRGLEERIDRYAMRHKLKRADVEATYKARLAHELAAIRKQGVVRYFLVIWRMYNWARSMRIECGPGRGSAGGCIVSFLMFITDIDPIEYGLLFERFLSPERIDLPDVDCLPSNVKVDGRSIDQVVPGDIIKTPAGLRCVEATHARPFSGKLVEIEWDDGEKLQLSHKHPIVTVQDGKSKRVRCSEIQVGDICFIDPQMPHLQLESTASETLIAGSGFHQVAQEIVSDIQIRAKHVHPSEQWASLYAGLLCSELERVCGAERLAWPGRGKAVSHLSGSDVSVSQAHTAQRPLLQEAWTSREDGTAMRHMWLQDAVVAGRQQDNVLPEGVLCSLNARKVKAVQEVDYTGWLYDLTIAGAHCFYANGALVGNCDFESERREEVIQYLRDTYGEANTCQIATVGTLKGKQCLIDIARVLSIPDKEVREVTASIVERSSGDERASQTIEDAFKDFDVCRKFNAKYPEVLALAKKLEGQARNLGIHAAGVVVCPVPITDVAPIETRKIDERRNAPMSVKVSAFDMYGSAAVGLMKIDILGIRNLDTIRSCREMIKKRHGIDVDWDQIDMEDPQVLQSFTDHSYIGIFQFDTPAADKISEGVKFTAFEDVAAMIALDRPGTARSGLATEYLKRKNNPKMRKSIHPIVDAICSDTLGVIVYQEHVTRIFVELAGFSPATADSLRKKIAKKWGDEAIGKERENFIRGAVERGCPPAIAEDLISKITFFGSYGFNKTIGESAKVYRAGANASTGPEISIKELVANWNKRDERGWLSPIAQKMRYTGIKILRMDVDGRIRPGKLKAIHDHGVWPVHKVTLESGKNVKAKLTHRFGTPGGYSTLGELKVGDLMLTMGEHDAHAYSSWWLNRDSRFAQEGRNTDEYRALVQVVRSRAGDKCERCGAPSILGRGGHEAAHIQTPAQLDYNKAAFHAVGNLKWLCNRCHKQLDYEKGERVKRWSKGRPLAEERIVSIEPAGTEHCYDLEMEGDEGHNYIANGFVSHNSHSIAYGLIGYRQMYLKTFYPIEYMWALLKHEPDRGEISRLVKEARRLGITVSPPEVNQSTVEWAINADSEIIASLIDLKGVAENTVKEIEAKRPFKHFIDFARRVDRRRVNRAHVQVLIKSGAMRDMVPNQKWALENVQKMWDMTGRGKASEAAALMLASASEPDWDADEAQIISSEVNPLSFGKHPMEPYNDFTDNFCQVPWLRMDQEDLFDQGNGWVNGIVLEVKYNQIGDFHTGAEPSEDDKKKQRWGARYANINVEDISGKQNRIKVDHDIFDTYRPIIDKKEGTVVAAHVSLGSKYKNIRAHFLVDLEVLRLKVNSLKMGYEPLRRAVLAGTPGIAEKFGWEERVLMGAHPAANLGAKCQELPSGRIRVTGIVTHLNLKLDKNMNEMAFFGVHYASGYVDVMCFSSAWPDFKAMIKVGKVIRGVFKPTDRGDGYILDNDVNPAVKLLD